MALLTHLSLAQAAKVIGISRTTLYRYIHAGKVPVIHGQDGLMSIDTSEILRMKEYLRSVDEIEPTFLSLISEVKTKAD